MVTIYCDNVQNKGKFYDLIVINVYILYIFLIYFIFRLHKDIVYWKKFLLNSWYSISNYILFYLSKIKNLKEIINLSTNNLFSWKTIIKFYYYLNSFYVMFILIILY